MKHTTKKSPLDRDELVREVKETETQFQIPTTLEDAPYAVFRGAESKAISIRLPTAMIQLLKGFAKQQGIGYQVLIKRWLDDRLRFERKRNV